MGIRKKLRKGEDAVVTMKQCDDFAKLLEEKYGKKKVVESSSDTSKKDQ